MYEREENAQFSLISYSKERRFRVFQTLPDSWKTKKLLQVLTWFLKLVYYRDYLSKIWRKSKIHDCQPILENYRHWLLTDWVIPSRLTWRAWWQEQGIMGREKRRKSKSLSLDFLFRIQARARSTTKRWKTWRINRLAINKYNWQTSLYFGTVSYDLLSQCFSGRKQEPIKWSLHLH